MAGTQAWRTPPSEVWWVRRIPGPNEPNRYYSVKNVRLFARESGVKQYMAAHPNDEFVVRHGTVTWDL